MNPEVKVLESAVATVTEGTAVLARQHGGLNTGLETIASSKTTSPPSTGGGQGAGHVPGGGGGQSGGSGGGSKGGFGFWPFGGGQNGGNKR